MTCRTEKDAKKYLQSDISCGTLSLACIQDKTSQFMGFVQERCIEKLSLYTGRAADGKAAAMPACLRRGFFTF